MLLDIPIFFGRFHPLIVHLPIGFLLMAVFFGMLSLIRKYRRLRNALPVALLLGSISAALACITGYVLSLAEDYDMDSVDNHMWAGICVTIISFLAYFMSIKKMPLPIFRHFKTLIVTLIFLLIFINITGHLGGSLTHGEDFLTSSFRSDKQNQKRKISNMNDAYVFNDIVQPILQDKCGSCHNSSKKKGKLSVESYDAIIKGGKHGRVIKPGDTTGSEIIKRISLDPQDEKFMPADNKTPLTAGETAIIKWWIEKAAGKKDTKLSEIGLPDNIKNNILA